MKYHVLAAAALWLLSGPADAVDRTADAADFGNIVKICMRDAPDTVEACIDDQVSARINFLGDIIAETEHDLDAKNTALLEKSQAAFEAYKKATCDYQVAANGKDDTRAELFCGFRLTTERIVDITEGSDYLSRD